MNETTETPATPADANLTAEIPEATDILNAPVTPENPVLYAGEYSSIGDLELSYTNLKDTFDERLKSFKGAPGEYTYTGDESAVVDLLKGWGAENQLTQDGFNDLVSKYNENQEATHAANIQQELENLGKDSEYRIKNVKDFLHSRLGESMTQDLASTLNTSKGIEAIEKLMKYGNNGPVNAPVAAINADKVAEMRFAKDENGQRKMSNPTYRAEVLKLEAQLGK